jgi:quaternary ammonium compound-resistance protein SugE
MSAWMSLLIAGVFEIVWATSMKYSQGMSRLFPTILMYLAGFASFYFLSGAVEHIPIGTAYAVWTGIGAIGTALMGMLLFGESAHWLRLMSIAVVLLGIAGLRLSWQR